MGLQPFNGHEIAIEVTAAEALPPYRLLKFNSSDKTKVNLATAGDDVIGVDIPTEEEMMSDGNGGWVVRTQYQVGEKPTTYDSGTVWVEVVAATVNAGDKCIPGASGKGDVLPALSGLFTAWNLSNAPANTAINSAGNQTITDIIAALTKEANVCGKYLKSGVAGDILPMKIK